MATIDVALERVAEAARAATRTAEDRDAAIREAHAAGVTLRKIAEVAGLSHSRVHQIVREVD